jgi:hypothetical protein
MRDNSISFWSALDNFDYERKIVSYLPNFQFRIWYLELMKKWVTTDKTYGLHFWVVDKNEPDSMN